MKKIKYLVRLFGFLILILLASSGIGITGHFLPANRERYLDKEIKIEQVDKREEENNESDEES